MEYREHGDMLARNNAERAYFALRIQAIASWEPPGSALGRNVKNNSSYCKLKFWGIYF
jgi:hypothetical protein